MKTIRRKVWAFLDELRYLVGLLIGCAAVWVLLDTIESWIR
jgi:hypothetical protein